MRIVVATLASIVLFAGCGGGEPVPETTAETVTPAPPTLPESAPDPTVAPPEPLQADRLGAMMLSCGGEQFRVAFTDTGATQINDDGSNTNLPLLPAGPDSEPGVSVYTDGRISFAKKGGGETPTEIRFARGRMAWVDCAIAVN